MDEAKFRLWGVALNDCGSFEGRSLMCVVEPREADTLYGTMPLVEAEPLCDTLWCVIMLRWMRLECISLHFDRLG
jgi:hypothetical protein